MKKTSQYSIALANNKTKKVYSVTIDFYTDGSFDKESVSVTGNPSTKKLEYAITLLKEMFSKDKFDKN